MQKIETNDMLPHSSIIYLPTVKEDQLATGWVNLNQVRRNSVNRTKKTHSFHSYYFNKIEICRLIKSEKSAVDITRGKGDWSYIGNQSYFIEVLTDRKWYYFWIGKRLDDLRLLKQTLWKLNKIAEIDFLLSTLMHISFLA